MVSEALSSGGGSSANSRSFNTEIREMSIEDTGGKNGWKG